MMLFSPVLKTTPPSFFGQAGRVIYPTPSIPANYYSSGTSSPDVCLLRYIPVTFLGYPTQTGILH
eukprot:766993-Hanusia_phi.AAC.5